MRLSASGVQKILRRHQLGRRAQRVAALAQLTAVTTGIVTSDAKQGPFGFCHFAARPGDLVALDTFYVGKLKGIGPVWQLTAVDTATRYAVAALVAGDKSARDTAAFVDHVAQRLTGIGAELTGVLSDNGPEFTAKTFTEHLRDRGLRHHRIPPRSPNQRRLRALPRNRPPGVLPPGLPPPALHSPDRSQRPVPGVAAALQHQTAQPQRLHARPHPYTVMTSHLR